MGTRGIWLASASKRRSILLEEFISKSEVDTFLVSMPLIEDEISPKYSTLKQTVFSITKMKMQNALLEISLGRLEQLKFNDKVSDLTNVVTIVSDTLVEDPDSFEQVFGKANDTLEAASMLKRLSGRRHKVWSSTGLIIHNSLQLDIEKVPAVEYGEWLGFIWTDVSTVEIDDLSDEIFSELLYSNSWVGKAGGYDLDGEMSKYANVINGEKITVLGLASSAIVNLKSLFKF